MAMRTPHRASILPAIALQAPSGSHIAAHIGSRCSPDARVIIGDSPFWFERRRSDGDKRPRADTLGRVYARFPEILVSESKSTFECARKHSKINDLRDTRGRGCADRQPARLPARLLARRWRLRGNATSGTAIASPVFFRRALSVFLRRESSQQRASRLTKLSTRFCVAARAASSRLGRDALASVSRAEDLLHSRTRAASGCTRDVPSARGDRVWRTFASMETRATPRGGREISVAFRNMLIMSIVSYADPSVAPNARLSD